MWDPARALSANVIGKCDGLMIDGFYWQSFARHKALLGYTFRLAYKNGYCEGFTDDFGSSTAYHCSKLF